MKIWILGALITFALPALAAKPPADGDELLRIVAHRSLLDELFHQPISQSQPISDYVKGTLMQGTALTDGTVTAVPYPSQDGIGLAVLFQSTTNAFTLNTNVPRPDIQVQFNWTIATTATTQKNILLRESGFALYPAQSWARSMITVQDLQTSASGLFWRLKSRIADRRAWQQLEDTKAENEQQAANQIASELNRMVDQRAWDQLLPLHNNYYTYVYQPLVLNGLLGGRLRLGSSDAWLVVEGDNGPNAPPLDVARLPDLDPNTAAVAPIQFRLSAALIERLAQKRLAGLQITDVELAAAMKRLPPQPDTEEGILGNGSEELLLTFDEKSPVQIEFDQNRIHLRLRVQELTTLGTTLKEVELTRDIQITQDANGPALQSELPTVLPRHYDGSAIREPLARYIGGRFATYLPQGLVPLSDKTFFPTSKPMTIRLLTADRGKLTVGLATKH